jgi:hypothetical protein
VSGEATGGAAPQAGAAAQPQAGAGAGGQEPPAGTGQAPASGEQPGTGNGLDGTATVTTETAEQKATRLERENGELRREQASNRTKLRTLEDAQAAAAQAGMTELQKAQKAAKDAEAQRDQLAASLQEQAIQASAMSAATKLNFRNPELAYRLLDRAQLEFSDSGLPKNAEALLGALAKAEPYLVKATGQDYGGGNRGTTPESQPGMNELLKAALGRG